MFKTEESARNALAAANTDSSTVTWLDDFGQEATIDRNQIHGSMLEELDKSKLARIEMELHAVRTKLKANEIADADPMIRQARARQQGGGMPMLQPMGAIPGLQNGRFPS